MKQLLVAVAVVSLATTGCVNTSQLARKNCGPACHVARSQSAPRPNIMRTVCLEGGLLGKRNSSCDPCCGDCESTCGYPEDCCDASCECSCGCPEECCSDGCCGGESGCCACDSESCCGGCESGNCGGGGRGCGPCQRIVGQVASGFCPHSRGYPATYNFNPGPPSGQTAYPYYTTRGPRDFLQNNPPTIGPY